MHDPSNARCLVLRHCVQPPGWSWNPSSQTSDQSTTIRYRAPEQPTQSPPTADGRGHSDGERELHLVCARFSQALAETLDGRRGIGQLRDCFDADSLAVVYAGRARLKDTPVRLASVRVQPRSEASAEVTLRLTTPRVDHAAALRVTHQGDHWTGTDLVLG